jgi:hypothetical protein
MHRYVGRKKEEVFFRVELKRRNETFFCVLIFDPSVFQETEIYVEVGRDRAFCKVGKTQRPTFSFIYVVKTQSSLSLVIIVNFSNLKKPEPE